MRSMAMDVAILFLLSTYNRYPIGSYLFKVNNGNTRSMCEIYSKLIVKTPEWRHWQLIAHTKTFKNFQKLRHFKFFSQNFTKNLLRLVHSILWISDTKYQMENGRINNPSHRTKSYGRYSVTINAIYIIWNFLQSQHLGTLLYLFRTTQLKDLIINYFSTRFI